MRELPERNLVPRLSRFVGEAEAALPIAEAANPVLILRPSSEPERDVGRTILPLHDLVVLANRPGQIAVEPLQARGLEAPARGVAGVAAAGGEGALIGGPIGAGAGTAVAYFTGKRNIHLRPETPLTFRLEQPVTIDVKRS
jgi:hypothetical protein